MLLFWKTNSCLLFTELANLHPRDNMKQNEVVSNISWNLTPHNLNIGQSAQRKAKALVMSFHLCEFSPSQSQWQHTGVGQTRNQPTKELENFCCVLENAHTISGCKNKQNNMHFYHSELCLYCQNKKQIIKDCILTLHTEWLQSWGFFPGFFHQTKYSSALLILGFQESNWA